RTSQNRKSRIPVAVALRNALTCVGSPCIRPMGRPRKMVEPATAPRMRIWAVDIGVRLTLQVPFVPYSARNGARPLRRRVPGDDLLPRLSDRGVPALELRHARARLARGRDAGRL